MRLGRAPDASTWSTPTARATSPTSTTPASPGAPRATTGRSTCRATRSETLWTEYPAPSTRCRRSRTRRPASWPAPTARPSRSRPGEGNPDPGPLVASLRHRDAPHEPRPAGPRALWADDTGSPARSSSATSSTPPTRRAPPPPCACGPCWSGRPPLDPPGAGGPGAAAALGPPDRPRRTPRRRSPCSPCGPRHDNRPAAVDRTSCVRRLEAVGRGPADGPSAALDVPWGEVNRLRRGTVDLPLGGAPDVLRAIYGCPAADGRLEGDRRGQLRPAGRMGPRGPGALALHPPVRQRDPRPRARPTTPTRPRSSRAGS